MINKYILLFVDLILLSFLSYTGFGVLEMAEGTFSLFWLFLLVGGILVVSYGLYKLKNFSFKK